ncbi:hypothetical protein BLNAU_23131 [Blattamonas nauphoetae]|uniref:Uncharacterized protein n=1 Tax=Blattamonas nauphoetae TaxID=2049346 RepID=A0ABQ9WS84_9EUKA|nr:hypothetical protein BLNAU_23131 [Blattamonas nauphoetae]
MSQKMLGCVVSLTSSHLSGSTIRDVNNGGSVLCSNSSFSSLLPSPNTDLSITYPNGTSTHFDDDGTDYYFDSCSGDEYTFASFSHCHFTGTHYGFGARPLTFMEYPGTVSILSCSFTSILFDHSFGQGAAVYVILSCSAAEYSWSYGGALGVSAYNNGDSLKQLRLVGWVIADWFTLGSGGGVDLSGCIDLSVVDTLFEHCEVTNDQTTSRGGGISVRLLNELTVARCSFVECSSGGGGSAVHFVHNSRISISDSLVQNCSSGATGAICICSPGDYAPLSLSRVGMIIKGDELESDLYDSVRCQHAEFNNIGPVLTAKPTGRVNRETGKIELEMKAITPPTSQEFEVTMKEDGNETDTVLRMLFSEGTGTLIFESEASQKYNTAYTITKIVGVVPDSSSYRMPNGVTVPAIAWPFNLAVNSDFLTFTTPKQPSTLLSAISNIISDDSKCAHVILIFNKEVYGSFDVVVEEDGKDVMLTVPILTEALAGESGKFVIVGSDRLLTHDTTYTIKSIEPTPGTDTLFVFMNRSITFHIPKSLYVPPEEPEPEDPEDPKKAMSPETKKLLSWLIPLVACLLIALLLAVVLIVLLRRRLQKKAQFEQKEMEAQETL